MTSVSTLLRLSRCPRSQSETQTTAIALSAARASDLAKTKFEHKFEDARGLVFKASRNSGVPCVNQ